MDYSDAALQRSILTVLRHCRLKAKHHGILGSDSSDDTINSHKKQGIVIRFKRDHHTLVALTLLRFALPSTPIRVVFTTSPKSNPSNDFQRFLRLFKLDIEDIDLNTNLGSVSSFTEDSQYNYQVDLPTIVDKGVLQYAAERNQLLSVNSMDYLQSFLNISSQNKGLSILQSLNYTTVMVIARKLMRNEFAASGSTLLRKLQHFFNQRCVHYEKRYGRTQPFWELMERFPSHSHLIGDLLNLSQSDRHMVQSYSYAKVEDLDLLCRLIGLSQGKIHKVIQSFIKVKRWPRQWYKQPIQQRYFKIILKRMMLHFRSLDTPDQLALTYKPRLKALAAAKASLKRQLLASRQALNSAPRQAQRPVVRSTASRGVIQQHMPVRKQPSQYYRRKGGMIVQRSH